MPTNSTHKKLDLKEYSIHYFTQGERTNPAVIFLHPAFCDHTAFYKQMKAFTPEYFVIAIDLLGHGLSKVGKTKDEIHKSSYHIAQILNQEGKETAHIIGVSMGALIAQYFALEHPEKILSVTSVGGYDINQEQKDVRKLQQKELFPSLLKAIFNMNSFRRHIAKKSALLESEQGKFYEGTKGFTRKSFPAMGGLNKIVKNRIRVRRAYPLCIVVGDQDNALAIKLAQQWHQYEDGSQLCIIENAGHCANMDNSEVFNSCVLRFLQTTNDDKN